MEPMDRPDILKMVEQNDHEGLRRVMDHEDPIMRLKAAQALADLGYEEGWQRMDEILRGGETLDVRVAAADLIGELRDARTIPLLRDTLLQLKSVGTVPLANAIRNALQGIGTVEAEDALRSAGYEPVLSQQHHTFIEYTDDFVKAIPAQAGEIQFLTAEEHLNSAVEQRDANLAERGLVECNIALWLKPDWAYAWYLRGVLLEDLERIVEALVAYRTARELDPGHAETREALNEVEGQVSPLQANPLANPDRDALLSDLVNGSWQDRRDAAAMLGYLNDRTSLDALVLSLQDPEREVRHAALEAIINMARREPLDASALAAVLEMQESSWLLRFTRLQALAELGSVDGLVQTLAAEMEQVQHRNPVFHADKDPQLEVEYDLMQEVGVLAMERTGDVEGLLAIVEDNAWVEVDEEEGETFSQVDAMADGWIDEEELDEIEASAWDAEENLESYVDEAAQLATAALDRLARERLPELTMDIVQRLAQVPDLQLLDLGSEDPESDELITVYDLGGLRAAAQAEMERRGV